MVNQQCKDTFDALVKVMRDIKARYFFLPPLDNSDLVFLGLKPKDTILTPVGPPQTIVNVTLTPIGKNLFNVRMETAAGQ